MSFCLSEIWTAAVPWSLSTRPSMALAMFSSSRPSRPSALPHPSRSLSRKTLTPTSPLSESQTQRRENLSWYEEDLTCRPTPICGYCTLSVSIIHSHNLWFCSSRSLKQTSSFVYLHLCVFLAHSIHEEKEVILQYWKASNKSQIQELLSLKHSMCSQTKGKKRNITILYNGNHLYIEESWPVCTRY